MRAGEAALFHPIVAGWFGERLGEPTPAQARGWPAIAGGGDVLVAAPTGSGKTLAAFLHALDGLVRRGLGGPLDERTAVLYISPLRALSRDVRLNLLGPLDELRARAEAAGTPLPEIRVGVRTGDTSAADRQKMAKRPPHVLVTTPESLYILLTSASGRKSLAGVRTVIVDEIHALAGDRRGAHLALSLERLDALVAAERGGDGPRPQRIGLSATQRPLELVANFLTGGGACTVIDEGHRRALDLDVLAPDGELAAVCSHEQWGTVHDQVAELARAHRSTLVFANTRRLVERAAAALTQRLGEDAVGAHHGALAQEQRLQTEQRLKAGSLRVIVATNSLELGIDVGAVDLVVQLGSPRSIRGFLQRVGRAGHAVGATPKGRLFALTRDDLVECAALVRAVRAGRLDALCVPPGPLDVLAQQLVAACVAHDWDEASLYALARRAWPYRELPRERFDQVVEMLADGFATRRGRAAAHLHRDLVHRTLRARRGARLAAVRSGGSIPDRADYEVVVDPEGVRVGTLDEDFAIESSAGDVIQLGNMSWKIRRVEAGRVRVEDARGAPPSVPFWNGEGAGRTAELSEEVAALRADVVARDGGAVAWLGQADACGLAEPLARQLHDYVAAAAAALGCVPTQTTLVAERFFDEAGGMQLVIHAPFGARLNRAWGLALRKKFCRTFDFELQAVATDDGVLLSLGPQHSFPLESIFHYVASDGARETLTQAALQAPMWGTRWRWNAVRALAVPRFRGGGKTPAPLVRMMADDLLAAVFPASQGCQDNHGGVMRDDIELPDHPLVVQTLGDCLDEAMDTAGLIAMLERLERGELTLVARDTPEPSPLAHQLLNANPYAYLDDAPLEERRTRAVSTRRGLPAELARELGALDERAVATVREDAWPAPRDADELHDVLLTMGALPEAAADPSWRGWLDALAAARRAARATTAGGRVLWIAAERLHLARAAYGPLALDPAIVAPAGSPQPDAENAAVAVVRGWLEHTGPHDEAGLAAAVGLPIDTAAIACARLEGDGQVLRGRFLRDAPGVHWCDRRLLARIHHLTLGRLRREIEPVPPATLARFVRHWQHATAGARLHGVAGLEAVLDQLQGVEAPVAAWERDILPARVDGYAPGLLDELCLSGEFVWGRRSASTAQTTTRATPIAFWRRAATAWMLGDAAATPPDGDPEHVAAVTSALAARGALFHAELLEQTGLLRQQLDAALWALVASGRVTADGFGALRGLADESPRRTGRWSLLGVGVTPATDEARAEAHARQLLSRYGVVLRDLVARELVPPWRDLLIVLRRLEARGELRGGRFVAGFVGEQFALPAAVESLRALRTAGATAATIGEPGALAPRDPVTFVEQAATRHPTAPVPAG